MNPAAILVVAFVVFAIILVAKSIKIVQQAEVMIVERLGKYQRTLAPGINVLVPIVDQPRAIIWMAAHSASARSGNVAAPPQSP